MTSKCKNLRLAETCATCRHVVRRWDYEGGYDFLHYCNIDGDAPANPDDVLGGSVDESLKILDAWDAWAYVHSRCPGNTCDAQEARVGVGFHCFGTYGEQPTCPVCAYRIECQQASLPRKSPPVYDPYGE